MSVNIETNNPEKCDYALIGLYEVYDPEVGLNVVDLGLIYELDFDEDNKSINCRMTLTTQFCPMGDSITSDIMQSLTDAFGDYQINVNLTFNPPWSFEKISPEGRAFLGR